MNWPPQPPQPPSWPPQPPRRRPSVSLGAVFLGALVVIGLAVGAVAAVGSGNGGGIIQGVLPGAILITLLAGSVMVFIPRPFVRGLGIGILIGWAVVIIVGAGVCVAILANLNH
jgi:hypothetical protein